MKKAIVFLCLCLCFCLPVRAQAVAAPNPPAPAPQDAGADWFQDFINRAFLLFLPKDDEVVVLADSDIDVWHGKWFFYSNLDEGESFDLSDDGSRKVFSVRSIGVKSVTIDYRVDINRRYPPLKTSVSGTFETGYSPAWKAISYFGLEGEMRGLISDGFDVNTRDSFGRTPLMIAAFCGHEKLCKILLRAGADVNAVQKDGLSALMLATRHPDIVELLIKNDADVDAADGRGRNVLVYASTEQETMGLLLEDGEARTTGPDADRALMWVVRFGSSRCLQLLLDNGADANARVDKASMLRWAIRDRRDRAIGILMTAGAQE